MKYIVVFFISLSVCYANECYAGTAPDLSGAVETAVIGGENISVDGQIWLNLMPPIPLDGPDLNVVVKVNTENIKDITVKRAWIFQEEGGEAIELTLEERPPEVCESGVKEFVGHTKHDFDKDQPIDMVTEIITDNELSLVKTTGLIITVTH